MSNEWKGRTCYWRQLCTSLEHKTVNVGLCACVSDVHLFGHPYMCTDFSTRCYPVCPPEETRPSAASEALNNIPTELLASLTNCRFRSERKDTIRTSRLLNSYASSISTSVFALLSMTNSISPFILFFLLNFLSPSAVRMSGSKHAPLLLIAKLYCRG